MITSAGLELLGDHAPKKWLNVESISAAKAHDVTCRAELGVMSRSESARLGGKARAAQMFRRPYALTG
jgi:hypothetical protein